MPIPRFVIGMLSISLMVLAFGVVSGQDYPNKPIRIVTTPAGGAPDIVSRLLAPGLKASVGWQVVVDNRLAGVIQGQILSQAAPDGYTLLVAGNPLWLLPLMQKTPYDSVRDFSPITLLARSPNMIVVHPSMPVKSAKELISLAKAHPGTLNYASGASGASNHLAAELFKSMASVNIVRIPYSGGGPALSDLIGGHVQLMFASAPSMSPHMKSGRLRAVAVTSAEPSALAPGLPTVASTVPGYESVAMYCMFAPAKTPEAIIRQLNQEIVRVLNSADVKEKFFSAGVEAVDSSPEQLASEVKSEIGRLGKVIKDAGIKAD